MLYLQTHTHTYIIYIQYAFIMRSSHLVANENIIQYFEVHVTNDHSVDYMLYFDMLHSYLTLLNHALVSSTP